MKIAIVHNSYGKRSGEEVVVEMQTSLLRRNGFDVCSFARSSEEISKKRFGKFNAFLSGIYNPFSNAKFKKFLEKEKPDVVHIHNLYPLISPSVLSVARQMEIPVAMTVHNYRLVCPNGLYFSHGEVCERCEGSREYWCFLRNCEEDWFKSFGYFLRSWWARKMGYFTKNVTTFLCLTQFQCERLVKGGINRSKVKILPNSIPIRSLEKTEGPGEYVAFAGRLSIEKGASTLLEVARNNTDITFAVAGPYDDFEANPAPNVKLLGQLDGHQMADFYSKAKCLIVPSICFEGFPMVVLEAMMQAKPVVCSRIGGLPDIVEDGVVGLLAEAGKASDFGRQIRKLWDDPDLCLKLGTAARRRVLHEYSIAKYYEELQGIYLGVESNG
ncbi:MAG: glycosyltransferase family 4 protein [Pseudomonadota bacterium]